MSRQDHHDRHSNEYCDACQREYLDLMDSLAHRTSHDTTPLLPPHSHYMRP